MSELTEELGMPKATVFRMLITMADHDIIQFDSANESYSLGYAVLGIADIALQQSQIRTEAYPEMLRLRDTLDVTVALTFRTNVHRIDFDKVESSHAIQNSIELGVPIPLSQDAAGYALISSLNQEDLRAYLANNQVIQKIKRGGVDEQAFHEALAAIREKGYAVTPPRDVSDGIQIAAPIAYRDRRTHGALYLSIPSYRHNTTQIETNAEKLMNAAMVISSALAEKRR